ncbi:hypothetical protein HC928_03385 [bacterium]|nr:hypothetical protein [bacterium]
MATIKNQRYAGKSVVVDGNHYIGCAFVQCTLIYRGGEMPVFDRCDFRSTGVQLEDAASDTIAYLNRLYGAGLWTNVEGVLDNVKQGRLAAADRPEPCDRSTEGTNFARLGLAAGLMVAVTVLVMFFIWYGLMYAPQEERLNQDQPIRVEIPLDVMPVLPDDLAAVYDQTYVDQEDFLATYGWIDEADGIARIPVDEAIQRVLDEGLPTF